jgi:hypothetical protein
LFVNPENIDEYRIGEDRFENGGLNDGWVEVGSLDDLSFGFQSTTEAMGCYLNECNGVLEYKGGNVRFDRKGLLEAYLSGYLDSEFQSFLKCQADNIAKEWSNNKASLWVGNVLPGILSQENEEY